MKELFFKVEFLSDIVLRATSNNEGKILNLDYIPGSNFLGIAAKNYDDFKNSFDIFHSGKVRFGDATILYNNEITYKMPLSYFYPKLNPEEVYNFHFLNDDELSDLGQLKQLRNGYITKNFDKVSVDYNYLQKSAYDKEKRRSKDEQMFGFEAIPKGTVWQFKVQVDDEISNKEVDLIIDFLQGKKRLGKSKSAQYGLIKIEYLENEKSENIENLKNDNKQTFLYANSRLALFDENCFPTLDVKYICKDLDVDYGKTQIKAVSYSPHNSKRQSKDYERVCIEKGSVIVVNDITDEQIKEIKKGVGAYLSEGFGEILINPEFLMKKKIKLNKTDKKHKKNMKTDYTDDTIIFLQNRRNEQERLLDLAEKVNEFVDKNKEKLYKSITNSQWGQIRSICSNYPENYDEKIREFVGSGVKKWNDKQKNTLLNNHSPEFIKLVAMQMQKEGD